MLTASAPICLSARFSALQRAENSSMPDCTSIQTNAMPVSVLFSEPKIPQYAQVKTSQADSNRFSALQRAENSSIMRRRDVGSGRVRFQCSSASRKFLNPSRGMIRRGTALRFSALQRAENSSIEGRSRRGSRRRGFQCSSASRKFLNRLCMCSSGSRSRVSVLFSEPKIPQYVMLRAFWLTVARFSALQRAENSSISSSTRTTLKPRMFQCSSASRKFLNRHNCERRRIEHVFQCSSASRKFLNITPSMFGVPTPRMFQCSSASRKFLNVPVLADAPEYGFGFSALQRAENSSIWIVPIERCRVLGVSVLFSEPKIPQSQSTHARRAVSPLFQCSSASRKFLNRPLLLPPVAMICPVSVLFSEPKIPQCWRRWRRSGCRSVSVLFSEPKIPQYPACAVHGGPRQVSVLFSEPKIPQSCEWKGSCT